MQILDSISAEGPEYVLHELSGLHELGHHEIANELHHEGDDETYEMDGYILTWNSRRKYVSLDYQLDDIHSVSRSR
jgi:hypothetical protein